jgi:hypothetical protein
MEAIEILAREAGLPMPARDPRAAAVADRRTQLGAVMGHGQPLTRPGFSQRHIKPKNGRHGPIKVKAHGGLP